MDIKPATNWESPKSSKTSKPKSVTKHLDTQTPDAKVNCQVCGKIFKNPPSLRSHMRSIHTDRERPSCDICHRVFFNSANLRTHMKAVHSTRERPRFPCGFRGCEKTFLHKSRVSQHVKTEHAENPVRFRCTLCGKDFKTRTELETHIFTHTTEKPYDCATCGRSFASREHLKSHEMTHLEKSYRDKLQCDICPQTFLSKHALQLHTRVVHENPCTSCGKRFPNSTELKRHVEAKHVTNKDLVHSCDKCEYKSHSKHNLVKHRRRHNAARHKCYFCGKKFVTFYELVRHCGRVHVLYVCTMWGDQTTH
ncbi:gastrula zinc finger protein XlCGF7.1 [Folsomia candida]|uniref:gastrula zinc finger protein XlCGF7.1 n=1 Tax=Folsomia candida TaxID=158441 RepID=UPI000B8F2143|nr:gastrula zinc finger protein XlCGF7.1 [Folsomia candida]XP_035713839.1 gastrula zinc finger protein XlCGF7.1 [Folsomia candida]